MIRALFAAWVAWLGLGIAACYSTPTPPCAFVCGEDNACPDGYSCAADGWCKRDGVSESTVCEPARPPDGAPPGDAPDIDATPDDATPDNNDAAPAGDDAAPGDAASDGAPGDADSPADAGSEDAASTIDAPISTPDAAPVPDASSAPDALSLAP